MRTLLGFILSSLVMTAGCASAEPNEDKRSTQSRLEGDNESEGENENENENEGDTNEGAAEPADWKENEDEPAPPPRGEGGGSCNTSCASRCVENGMCEGDRCDNSFADCLAVCGCQD